MNFLACPSPGPRMCPCSSRHTNDKNAFSSDILDALNFFKDGQYVKTHLPSPSSGAMLFLSRRPRRARTCSQKLYWGNILGARPCSEPPRSETQRQRRRVSAQRRRSNEEGARGILQEKRCRAEQEFKERERREYKYRDSRRTSGSLSEFDRGVRLYFGHE